MSPSEHASAERRRGADELRGLFDAMRAQGRNDAALCLALAGTHLLGDDSPPDIRSFGEHYNPARPRRAGVPVDPKGWLELLAHRDESPYLTALFAAVAEPVRVARTVPLARLGFELDHAVRPAQSTTSVARVVDSVAHSLGVTSPLLYLATDRAGGFAHLPSDPPATVVGQDALAGTSLAQLHFVVGAHLAWYRPAYYLATLYKHDAVALSALLWAVLGSVRPALAKDAVTQRDALAMRQLLASHGRLEQVDSLVGLLFERESEVDVARWLAAARYSCFRAGLLVAGDLGAVAEFLHTLPEAPAGVLADLSTFALSEPYFALRQATGIALWDDQPEAVDEPEAPATQGNSLVPSALQSSDFEHVDIEHEDLPDEPHEPATTEQEDSPLARWKRARDADRRWEAWCLAQALAWDEGEALDAEVRAWMEQERPQTLGSLEPWLRLEEGARARSQGPLHALSARLEGALRRSRARSPDAYDAGGEGGGFVAGIVRGAVASLGLGEVRMCAAEAEGAVLRSPPCAPAMVVVAEDTLANVSVGAARFAVVEHLARLEPEGALLRWLPTDAMVEACAMDLFSWAHAGTESDGVAARQWAAWDEGDREAAARAWGALEAADELAVMDAVRGYARERQQWALRLAWLCTPDWDAAREALALPRWPAVDAARALEELRAWVSDEACVALGARAVG